MLKDFLNKEKVSRAQDWASDLPYKPTRCDFIL